MNILKKALDDLKYNIPGEILRIAFQDNTNWRQAPVSIDSIILNKVIRNRVLIDANLVGGEMVLIPLNDVTVRYLDTYTSVYEIPLEKTFFRNIISLLSVSYLPTLFSGSPMGGGVGMFQPTSVNDVSSASLRMMNSFANLPPVSTAFIELVGDNTVLIRNEMRISQAYVLRCIIGNEENLNNISIRSFQNFSRLCELAVKSYIYNNMIIKLDTAYLQGGQELGAIKSIIEGYSDSEQMYRDYLNEVWRPVAFMNDTQSHIRHIKMMVNPGI